VPDVVCGRRNVCRVPSGKCDVKPVTEMSLPHPVLYIVRTSKSNHDNNYGSSFIELQSRTAPV
jgi:hypothetical protein